MRTILAACLLAAPAAAAPPPRDPCAEYVRLAAAAEEAPTFASLAGTDLNGLLESYCPVSRPAPLRMLCTRSLLPREISASSVAEKFRQCVPGATITPLEEPLSLLVAHGRLRVEIHEHGGEGAHVGRIVTLYIYTDPEVAAGPG
jgi:hypothetical protein